MFDPDELSQPESGGFLDDVGGVLDSAGGVLGRVGGIFGGGGLIPSLTGGDAGPSSAGNGAKFKSGFDSSGWNVTFGDNSGIEATRSESQALAPYMQYALIAAGLLIAWRVLKRSR